MLTARETFRKAHSIARQNLGWTNGHHTNYAVWVARIDGPVLAIMAGENAALSKHRYPEPDLATRLANHKFGKLMFGA